MTTPFTANPIRDWVLKPTAVTTQPQSLQISGSSSPYVDLDKGISQVVVTWDGEAALDVFYGPDATWGNRRRIGIIPSATDGSQRRLLFSVSADTDAYVVFLMAAATQKDLGYTAGVQVINSAATV